MWNDPLTSPAGDSLSQPASTVACPGFVHYSAHASNLKQSQAQRAQDWRHPPVTWPQSRPRGQMPPTIPDGMHRGAH